MNIKIDFDTMERLCRDIDIMIEFLKHDAKSFEAKATFSKDEWSGSAADQYALCIKRMSDRMNDVCNNAELLSKLLKSHVKNYRNLDRLV